MLSKAMAGVFLHASDNSEARGRLIDILRLEGLGKWLATEIDVEGIAERAKTFFGAMQNKKELSSFLRFLHSRKPRTVVEIGTARGGNLFAMAQVADVRGLIVSIDLPGGRYGGGASSDELPAFESFRRPGQRFEFIRSPSGFHDTWQFLKSLLGRRRIDLLYIDGDHSYGGALADFEMYRSLVSRGGCVAFHDILMTSKEFGEGNDVGLLWRRLKKDYRTREFIDRSSVVAKKFERGKSRSWGIGVLMLG